MKIALVGATGFVGSAILKEALDRGHIVSAIVRDTSKISIDSPNLIPLKADVLNEEEVAESVKGHDAVISAYNPGWANPDIYNEFLRGAQSIQAGIKKAGIKRLIVVGGAGSLFVAPDIQLI